MFGGRKEYRCVRFRKSGGKIEKQVQEGTLTEKQLQVSQDLKDQFPAYINSLALTDDAGNPLRLEPDGSGSFREYVKKFLVQSAQNEWDTRDAVIRFRDLAVEGSEIEGQDYLSISDGKIVALDWDGFVRAITRMKPAPAFDALDLKSPENEEFGTETIKAKHFTAYAYLHSEVQGELADENIVRMLNPLSYVGTADTAKHWRIRHGSFDRDTALAIPVILATLLRQNGCQVDFALPWGLPHSGDYDLKELFDWIDGICKEQKSGI